MPTLASFKGLCVAIITVLIYKPLSPIIHVYGKFAIKSKKSIPDEVKDEPLTHVQETTEEKPIEDGIVDKVEDK